jgi:tungstate transport system substrate-binding protein
VLRLATTTTVEGSGLLETLTPPFERVCRCKLEAVAFGSGQALSVLEHDDADVSLTHDPEREQETIAAGHAQRYAKVMFNDFLIAGPERDPAGVHQATSAIDAMGRIARTGAAFASRGDSSGTHTRERRLWARAGVSPAGSALIETGQGMAATLRVASERQAYTLTDRATFRQLAASLRLTVLFEGDDELINTYAVMIRTGLSADRFERASAFFTWLADGDGRQVVVDYRVKGQPAFQAWPAGAPREQPGDLPHAR